MSKKKAAKKKQAAPRKAVVKKKPPPGFEKKADPKKAVRKKTPRNRSIPSASAETRTPWRFEPVVFFEGQTLITSSAALDDLPEPYQRVLTSEHRAAMADEPAYFNRLAAECRLADMKRWLQALAQADAWELHLTVASLSDGSPMTEAGIKAIRGGHWRHPLVRLRDPAAKAQQSPAATQGMFDLIAGTYHEPFAAGGLTHNSLNLVGDDFRPPVLVRDPSSVTVVFRDGAGDVLLAEGDRGVWHLHETNAFVDAGPLEDVLNGYFRMLVDGVDWFGDLYQLWRQQNPSKQDS